MEHEAIQLMDTHRRASGVGQVAPGTHGITPP